MAQKPRSSSKVVLLVKDRFNHWRPRRATLLDDRSVDWRGRTFLYSPRAVGYWPTLLTRVGLTKTWMPCIVVDEDVPLPMLMQPTVIMEDGSARLAVYQHDSSADLHGFKKSTLTRQLVNAAQKESASDVLKVLVIGALVAAGLGVLLLLYIISKLGILAGA